MFLQFNFSSGLFNAKTPILQFCILLPSDQPIGRGGGPCTSERPKISLKYRPDQKIDKNNKFLKLNFREGLFNAQMPNSKIFI